jgi:hypothetical protein
MLKKVLFYGIIKVNGKGSEYGWDSHSKMSAVIIDIVIT